MEEWGFVECHLSSSSSVFSAFTQKQTGSFPLPDSEILTMPDLNAQRGNCRPVDWILTPNSTAIETGYTGNWVHGIHLRLRYFSPRETLARIPITDCILPPLSGLPVVLRHPSSEADMQPGTLPLLCVMCSHLTSLASSLCIILSLLSCITWLQGWFPKEVTRTRYVLRRTASVPYFPRAPSYKTLQWKRDI